MRSGGHTASCALVDTRADGYCTDCARDHGFNRTKEHKFPVLRVWLSQLRVVAMLAEIFLVRLEAAARLQEQTASLSSSKFVPFTPSSQFVFKDRTARPADQPLRPNV
jgi:hypothetical protein